MRLHGHAALFAAVAVSPVPISLVADRHVRACFPIVLNSPGLVDGATLGLRQPLGFGYGHWIPFSVMTNRPALGGPI